MHDYEITYLTDPQLNEEARTELNSAIDGKINELAGSIMHASASLRRRLAYPIKKTNSAFLRHLQIQLDPSKTQELHTFLKKAQGLIRFTILQTAQRQEVGLEVLERSKKAAPAQASTAKPDKKVTMADVEKGIEEALTEEIK